jgi:hypothetical protein
MLSDEDGLEFDLDTEIRRSGIDVKQRSILPLGGDR